MVVDLNYHKVIRFFLSIIFFTFLWSNGFSENLNFEKIAKLKDPWGSSFISEDEIIVTEKSGNIKIINIDTKEILEVKHNLNYLVYGQGGLLDIIYKNNEIWISYTENRVNCVAPSLTKSKIAEPMLKNTAIAEGIAKAHPLKRLGEGKDSASLAKFLITEASSWVTGQIIAVDGGRSKLS